MWWRRPRLRWAVIFVACGLIAWRLSSPAGPPASPVLAVSDARSGVSAGAEQTVAADTIAVISVEEYSGQLLAAALGPGEMAPEPVVSAGQLYLSGVAPAPDPDAALLGLRFLRTQFRTYRSWVLSAPAPPLAFGLTDPLSDIRDVWRGTEALGPMEIVQPHNRLLRSDVTVTALAADGTVTVTYGGTAYTLRPGDSLRFAAARPPDAADPAAPSADSPDSDAIEWLDAATDDEYGEWLAAHLLRGSADTVLHVTNHGLFARADIHSSWPPAAATADNWGPRRVASDPWAGGGDDE